MLVLVALALSSWMQDPFPKPWHEPAGVVLDADGQPVAGARVSLRLLEAPELVYAVASAQVVAKTPLPIAFSGDDGSFVLPLTRDHRRLGSWPGDGRIALLVEKEGYQTWCETLTKGLPGYLGSKVRLARLEGKDRMVVTCLDVREGMFLHVKRWLYLNEDPGQLVPVPQDGKVIVHIPPVPTPFRPEPRLGFQGVVFTVRTLYPGRGSDPIVLGEAVSRLEIPPGPPRTTRWIQVRRRDEQEVVGLRARFRYPDGSLRWFDLPNDEVPSDPSLPVVALVAAGCAETTEVDDPILDASDSPKPQRGGSDVTVIVTDAKGSPIPAATIRASNSCFRGLELSGPLPISDRAGKVTLRAIPGGSHLILVLADGFMPEQRSIDLEGEGRVEVVVTLRPATTVDVEIVDENGKPLAFAPVSHRLAEAERTSMVACTSDSLGRLRLPWETGTDFELQACQIQESVNTPLGKLDMPLRFVCKRTPRILAHVSECGTLSWIEALRGDRLTFSASPQHPFAAPQCRTFLGSLPPETESTLLIHFESGPPARFQSNDFAAAQPDSTGFSVVERAKPVRRVPIAVTTSDGKAVEKLEIVTHAAPLPAWAMTRSEVLANCAERDERGEWRVLARDLGAWRCIATSAGYEPASFSVPAATAGGVEVPVALRLIKSPK